MTKRELAFPLKPVMAEFEGADLGDERREKRLAWMVERLADEPSKTFPEAWVTLAGVEAGYRLLRNPHVSAEAILEPHRAATLERARTAPWLLALQDTTEMRFGGAKPRAGLGALMNGGHGFFFHGALLASLDDCAERAVPLGLVASEILVRRERVTEKRKWREAYDDPEKESLRWNRLMHSVEQTTRAHELSVIHVADREASRFDLFAELRAMSGRFIVRVRRGFLDRATQLSEQRGELQRVADISARTVERGRRRAPQPRDARIAKLDYQARKLLLRRPDHVDRALGDRIEVNVVDVVERDAPSGATPITWTLVTSEPIETQQQIERVIDGYRSRWLIEEYWKALKTGCSFESRQLEGLATLERALAICVPIAWHMLLLRTVARDAPETPAKGLLSPLLYELLLALAPTNRWGFKLSSSPTAGELVWAIARIGGHLPANGAPGFITIRRGLDTLYELEAAAALLQSAM